MDKPQILNEQSLNLRRQRRQQVLLGLLLLLPVCLLLATALGAVSLPFSTVVNSIFGGETDAQYELIVTQIRLPRAILAALIGATLGICGAATQGLFRNPLADPSLIGVTAGASAGGSVMIVLSSTGLTSAYALSTISIGAFCGGAFAVWLVYRIATGPFGTSVATMLLAGIALTAIASSVTSLLEFFSDDVLLRQISLWQMGSLSSADYHRVWIALGMFLPMTYCLFRLHGALNGLLLGESEARHLGVDVNRVKLMLVLWVALGVGTSVAIAGTIAFVGLVVPHMIRLLIGPNHRYLLPASALAGAILLLISDLVSRIVLAPTEIPIGLVTALVGAPVFISLLRRKNTFGVNA